MTGDEREEATYTMKSPWMKTAAAFLLLAAVMGALQWNWFAMPLERDEGEYAYAAWLMRTGKGVPYKDSFLQKPPMIVYTYALVEALAPKSDKVGFRVAGFLAALATAGLVWKLGRREFGGHAGMWGAWLWVAFGQQLMFSPMAANVEKFMVVPMLGAMAVAGRGERRWWRWAAAGALAGIAVLYKPICVPVLGVFFVWRLLSPTKGEGNPEERTGTSLAWSGAALEAGRKAVWLVAGGTLAVAAGLAWFGWKGALGPMWECSVEFTGAYAGLTGHPFTNALAWGKFWGTWKLGFLCALVIGGMAARWRDGWGWSGMLVLSTVLAMTGVNGHYYLMALPFGALLTGAGIDRLGAKSGGKAGWTAAAVTAVAVLALSVSDIERMTMKLRPSQLCAAFYNGNPFVEAEGAGAVVASLCGEEGTVYVVGSEPEILWYARRKAATRFVIFYPLSLPTEFAGQYQSEALARLAADPPDVVVVALTKLGFAGSPAVYRDYWNRLVEMVGGEYVLEWAFVPGGNGWVRGGEWSQREREGATLGIFRRNGREETRMRQSPRPRGRERA